MTSPKEQIKSDLRKDPEDLEREADGARADLENTVDELMQQLSPSELIHQGISFVRTKSNNDFLRNLSGQMENNPIPTLLAGISLIWLMAASKRPSERRGESLTDTIGKKVGATRDKLSSAQNGVRTSSHDAAERTRATGQQVASGASNAVHRVTDAGRHTAERARDGLHNAQEGYSRMLHERPLLVGALAIAAGAALGTLLPRTPAEDRMMGGLSDSGTEALREKTEAALKAEQDKAAPNAEKPATGASSVGDSPSPNGAGR